MRAALVGAWLWQAEPKAAEEADKRDGWTGESNGNISRSKTVIRECELACRLAARAQKHNSNSNSSNKRNIIQVQVAKPNATTKDSQQTGTQIQAQVVNLFFFSLFSSVVALHILVHIQLPPICLSLQPIMGNPCWAPW
jgi:hypothetical protein